MPTFRRRISYPYPFEARIRELAAQKMGKVKIAKMPGVGVSLTRRADVVGSFPNEKAIRRLVGALLMEQNDEYAIQKRYMSLESLALLSENPPIRLPAAPALA